QQRHEGEEVADGQRPPMHLLGHTGNDVLEGRGCFGLFSAHGDHHCTSSITTTPDGRVTSVPSQRVTNSATESVWNMDTRFCAPPAGLVASCSVAWSLASSIGASASPAIAVASSNTALRPLLSAAGTW